jgi:F0F1-type ATP synthase delta subunit
MTEKKAFLASRYARAFLNVYCKEYTIHDFSLICEAAQFFKTHKKACFFMQLSLLDRIVKEESLHLLCNQLSLPESYKKLFSLLIDQKRVFLLPIIFKQLVLEYQRRASYLPIDIKTTVALNDEQKKTLVDFLAKQTQKIILPVYSLDKELIAGIRAISSSYLFEHSIQSILRNTFRLLH